MAPGRGRRSMARRFTGALADATGRPEEEVSLVVTAAAVAGVVMAALRLVDFLVDLGSDVHGPRHRHPVRAVTKQAGAA